MKSQGLIPVKKGDFFLLFWNAWTHCMTEKLVLKSFKATGIFPMDREVILKKYRPRTPDEAEDEPRSSPLEEADWRKIRRVLEQVVRDGQQQKAQKITASLHHLQVQNELLLHENEGLKYALTTKKKHKKKSKVLDLQQREEYHGGAVFWSPSKIREARYRERVRAREEEQEKLQKSRERDLKAAAALYEKQQLKKKRVEREALQKERAKEKERKAAERAELQRKKQQEKEAATAQKALQLSQKGKRAALPSIRPNAKRRRVAQPAKGGPGGGDPAPNPPPKINSRGRKINLPKKFK
jgi:hypothetical protein